MQISELLDLPVCDRLPILGIHVQLLANEVAKMMNEQCAEGSAETETAKALREARDNAVAALMMIDIIRSQWEPADRAELFLRRALGDNQFRSNVARVYDIPGPLNDGVIRAMLDPIRDEHPQHQMSTTAPTRVVSSNSPCSPSCESPAQGAIRLILVLRDVDLLTDEGLATLHEVWARAHHPVTPDQNRFLTVELLGRLNPIDQDSFLSAAKVIIRDWHQPLLRFDQATISGGVG